MEDTKVDCAVDRAESRAEVQPPFILRSFRTRPSPHRIIPAGWRPICFCHIGVRPSSGWPCIRPSTAHAKVPPTSKGHVISVGPNSHVCRRDSPCRIRHLEGGLFPCTSFVWFSCSPACCWLRYFAMHSQHWWTYPGPANTQS